MTKWDYAGVAFIIFCLIGMTLQVMEERDVSDALSLRASLLQLGAAK